MTKNKIVRYLFILLLTREHYKKASKSERINLSSHLRWEYNRLNIDEKNAFMSLRQENNLGGWLAYQRDWLKANPDDDQLFTEITKDRHVLKKEDSRYDPKIVSLIMGQRWRYMRKGELPAVTGTDRALATSTGFIIVPKEAFNDFPQWYIALREEFLRGNQDTICDTIAVAFKRRIGYGFTCASRIS